MSRGAGGTDGGVGSFFIGFIMMCAGFYMLLQSITVTTNFGLGYRFGQFSMFGQQVGITTGMVLVPFIFGVGIIFYNSRNIVGWFLSIGSLSAMIFGVIASVQFRLRTMSSFELIVIIVLSVGGVGLFLRSLRTIDRRL